MKTVGAANMSDVEMSLLAAEVRLEAAVSATGDLILGERVLDFPAYQDSVHRVAVFMNTIAEVILSGQPGTIVHAASLLREFGDTLAEVDQARRQSTILY